MIALQTTTTSLSVWPNPSTDYVSITGTELGFSSRTKVAFFSLDGKKQLEKQLSAGENSVNISSLKTGTYIVNIISADGRTANQKLVKH
jgi:hypothetical protein